VKSKMFLLCDGVKLFKVIDLDEVNSSWVSAHQSSLAMFTSHTPTVHTTQAYPIHSLSIIRALNNTLCTSLYAIRAVGILSRWFFRKLIKGVE